MEPTGHLSYDLLKVQDEVSYLRADDRYKVTEKTAEGITLSDCEGNRGNNKGVIPLTRVQVESMITAGLITRVEADVKRRG
jgi:hypothetical protein